MDGRAIPNDQEFSRKVPGEMAEEGDDLLLADAVGVGLSEHIAVIRDAADGGELVPLAAVADFRRFSSRRPGRAHHAFETRADFVHEDDRGVV